MNWSRDDSWDALLVLVIVAVVAGLGTVLVYTARADGRPDYCYFETIPNLPGAVLTQHRPWRLDHTVQFVHDAAEGAAVAKTIGCPLR